MSFVATFTEGPTYVDAESYQGWVTYDGACHLNNNNKNKLNVKYNVQVTFHSAITMLNSPL